MHLLEELYEDILLERKLLGERAHKGLRELELQAAKLIKARKTKLANRYLTQTQELWRPLREVQAESRANTKAQAVIEKSSEALRVETEYKKWRMRLLTARAEMDPQFTARGNSLAIHLSGLTARGPGLSTPRGYQSVSQIAAGPSHACLVHQNGDLYSWGIGAAGRLGLDVAENGDPQADVAAPTLVQALRGRVVTKVSCEQFFCFMVLFSYFLQY